jgi:hypothetical protein
MQRRDEPERESQGTRRETPAKGERGKDPHEPAPPSAKRDERPAFRVKKLDPDELDESGGH